MSVLQTPYCSSYHLDDLGVKVASESSRSSIARHALVATTSLPSTAPHRGAIPLQNVDRVLLNR